MNMLTRIAMLVSVPLAGAIIASSAIAGTATATIAVSATVVDSCSITATSMAFGNYSGLSEYARDSSATLTPTCTAGTFYSISLNAGTGTGGTLTTRKMTGPNGGTLRYGMYVDATRSTPWGDGGSGTGWLTQTGSGAAQPVSIFGRLQADQNTNAGAYSDTVTVTVTY